MQRQESINPDSGEEIRIHLRLLGAKVEKILLDSAPLRATYQQLRLPVYLKEPGCWLAAPFGEGKTIALHYCAKMLTAEIPGLPVFIVNEQVLPGNDLKSFFMRALIESKHEKPTSNSSGILRNRLARYWADLSQTSPLGCVVLLLDEGQAMRETDELLLKDLANEISILNGSLLIITFGESPGFVNLVEQRKMTINRNGAVDRLFCGKSIKLHEYESESDWKSLFLEMDTQKFIELGGKTITESYFGHIKMQPFKMENEANRFFRAIKKISGGKKKPPGFNLRRIFLGIRHAMLITALMSVDEKLNNIIEIPVEQWVSSVRYAYHHTN